MAARLETVVRGYIYSLAKRGDMIAKAMRFMLEAAPGITTVGFGLQQVLGDLLIKVKTGAYGLVADADGLWLNYGLGLVADNSTPKKVGVKGKTGGGLIVDADGVYPNLGFGLNLDASSPPKIQAKVTPLVGGVSADGTGISVNVASLMGLELYANALRVSGFELSQIVPTAADAPTALFAVTLPVVASVCAFRVIIFGTNSDSTVYGRYVADGLVKTSGAAATVLGQSITTPAALESDPGLDGVVTAAGNTLVGTVTGKAATAMRWQAAIHIYPLASVAA